MYLDIKGGTGPASALFINDQIDKPVPQGFPRNSLGKVNL